jgi:hypothetical protein
MQQEKKNKYLGQRTVSKYIDTMMPLYIDIKRFYSFYKQDQ